MPKEQETVKHDYIAFYCLVVKHKMKRQHIADMFDLHPSTLKRGLRKLSEYQHSLDPIVQRKLEEFMSLDKETLLEFIAPPNDDRMRSLPPDSFS